MLQITYVFSLNAISGLVRDTGFGLQIHPFAKQIHPFAKQIFPLTQFQKLCNKNKSYAKLLLKLNILLHVHKQDQGRVYSNKHKILFKHQKYIYLFFS